ncbi:S-layer family protein [Mesorhizobium sp. INR15]|uniref:beta strand repeat-containing protein n=1 Tax=Mesorhizobium sp. INR15 TaxID=2654248 RepID=UPI0018966BCE|nr:Ig-like domain-containing protein [Mesorhizobium sp. INR15]
MASSSQINTLFSGISDISSDPPHNALAVGPNNAVMAEGSKVEWTDLSGGAMNSQSVYQFFGSLGATATNALFDPRAAYDSVNQRYVVTIDNIGSGGAISNVDIAVSRDSNPNDGWYFYSLNTSIMINGQLTAADQPALSLDGTNIYITTPQYGVNVSGFAGTEQWVIGDTTGAGGGIYNGGTMTVVANQVASPNQGIARLVAGNNGQTYYASAENTGSQTLITLQTYNPATNSFGPTTTVSLGNIDQGGGGSDYTAQQQGTSVLLNAGDANIQNLAYSNGFLYGVSEVMSAGSSTPQVHWFKIDVSNPGSPTLVAQGDIPGAAIGSGVATFDGSIAVDQAGDVIINYTASGPGIYPADYYSFMAAADPSGTFSAPVLYQASSSYLANGDGGNVQRWGNNSSATADPSDPNSFWLSGEYVASGWWQTSVAQVVIQTPTANVTDRLSKDTGASSSDTITSNAKIGGTGVANAVVSFTVDGNAIATTVTANAGGAWTFTPSGLADGPHTIVASETGAPGNPSPASLTFTLDTTTPTVAIGNVGGATGQAALTVTGTVGDPDVSGPGSTVQIFDGTTQVGTATVQADGTWSTGITLSNGTNSLTARNTDLAGNMGTSAPVTYTITTPSSSIQTTFTGLSDLSDDPPDNGLAVGPGGIVMAEGQRVEWTNLAGAAATNMSAYSFFPPPAGANSWVGSLKDTFSAYDAVNNRFVYSSENLNPHSSPGSTNEVFAVSKGSNPNDGWYFGSISTSTTINGVATESDEPTLAVDGTNIYIASPQYNASGPGYLGSELWVISDTAGAGGGIYNGGTPTIIATQLTDPSQGIFRDAAGNNGKTYFASAYDNGGQSFMALQVYDVATNTFGSVTSISFGNIDQGTGGTTYYAQQQGSNVLLDVNDGRIGNLVYANGFLYGTNEIQSPGSSVPSVHWFKIDVSNPASPVMAAQGTISGDTIGANVATFNGSIAVDAAGDVIINFNASGPNMLPSDYYVLGKTDNLSFGFTTPVLYQASSQPFALDTNRWGSNSSAVVDPNNPNAFWISSEYIANNWWQTAVAQVAVQGSPTERLLNDTGASSSDKITSNATLAGTGTANAVVHFVVDGTAISSTATADSTGAWQFTPVGLADGQHTIVASETDALGNLRSASLTFSLDTTPPAVTMTNAGGTASQAALTVTGTVSDPDVSGPGATVAIFDGTTQVGTAPVQANGSWSTNITLTNGTNTLTARDTDSAGNVGSSMPVTYTYQAVAPDHIVIVVEENHGYSDLIGNPAAPYINSLVSQGTLFTNYHAVAHPSEPNYFAIFSGSTQGITTDGTFFFPTAPTLAGELLQAGDSFVGYAESPPEQDHMPWASFGDSQNTGQDFSNFPTDFSKLPTVSFVIPNVNNDMHDGTVAQGDQWLSTNLSAYVNWAKTHNSILVLTSDENDGSGNNQVATIVLGAGVGVGQNSQLFDHYSLLHTIENTYGLPTLGSSATAPIMTFAPVSTTTVTLISASGTGIASGNGDLNAGSTVTLTVNFSGAVTVNAAGGSPSLLLNDGGIAAYSGGSGTTALTFSYIVAAGQNTPDLTVSSLSLNGSIITDGAGNSADPSGATNYNPAGTLQIDATIPTIASIATSGTGITSGNGDLNAGKTVTLTVNFSEAVTVNAAGGSPSLLLNDGGVAAYSGGSGTTALTFSYTVASGQNTPDLTVSSLSLNGSIITDGAGNSADPSGATNYNPAGTLQIDATIPTIASIATSGTGITSGNGDLNAGKTVTLTVTFSKAVTVNSAGGSPRLLLGDGGIAAYSGGSGTAALTFKYTVAAGQNTSDLTISSFDLNGSAIADGVANSAIISGATNYNPAGTLQIDTTIPTIAGIATSGAGITNGNGDLNAGKTVALTVTFSEAVTVNSAGGSPRLLLNDGGIATYSGGSGTTALTFSYTVASGQNTPDLTVSSLSLNGSTIADPAGNNANLSGANNYNPAGTLQIDTAVPTIASISTSGAGIANGIGDLNAGKTVTLAVNFSQAVAVNTAGGLPRLLLNDGGIATYNGGSGTTALTFTYTVAVGQNTSDLTVSSFNLNGSTVTDLATNNANLSGANNYNPAGTLQIDTTVPTVAINTIAGNGNVSGLEALTGFAISGTSTNVENGQVVTVNIRNSQNIVVDSYTATDQNNAWSVNVTSAQAQALADGAYTVTADVADKAGNLAPLATRALIVDEDKLPEAPILVIANTALTVQAHGSIALGITATPIDSDDSVTLKIAGLPSYETITAPSGYSVSRALQLNGTYTWTISETSSTIGKPISGLVLASSYGGTGHPVATLTIVASNTTLGETASSTSRTMTVTDPPAIMTGPTSNLIALFNQYVASGFHDNRSGAGEIVQTSHLQSGHDALAFLATPGHFER